MELKRIAVASIILFGAVAVAAEAPRRPSAHGPDDRLGAIRYGIDELPPLVTRGVLLDMAAATGTSKVPGGTVFNRKEIERAAARQKVVLRKGDVVLLHAGHLAKADEEARHSLDSIAGLGVEGAEYLADLGVVAVGLDAWIPDAPPPEKEGEFLPVHGKLLVEHGVYILENVRTAELAADEAYEFLFVLGAPRFKGAVQSVVHPIAIR